MLLLRGGQHLHSVGRDPLTGPYSTADLAIHPVSHKFPPMLLPLKKCCSIVCLIDNGSISSLRGTSLNSVFFDDSALQVIDGLTSFNTVPVGIVSEAVQRFRSSKRMVVSLNQFPRLQHV